MVHTDPPDEYDCRFLSHVPKYLLGINNLPGNVYEYTLQLFDMLNLSDGLRFKHCLPGANVHSIDTELLQVNGKPFKAEFGINTCEKGIPYLCCNRGFRHASSFDIILKITLDEYECSWLTQSRIVTYDDKTETLIIPYNVVAAVLTVYVENNIGGLFRPPQGKYKKYFKNIMVVDVPEKYKTLTIKIDPHNDQIVDGSYDSWCRKNYDDIIKCSCDIADGSGSIAIPEEGLSTANDSFFSISVSYDEKNGKSY
jgi:hypothetical protein